MITMNCPNCQTSYRLKPELAGRLVRCRVCQENFQVPEDDGFEDEDGLQTISTEPVAMPKKAVPQKPRRRPGVDDLGFLTDYDDHEDHTQDDATEEDDDDHDDWMMRQAARRGAEAFDRPREPAFVQGAYRRKPSGPMIPPAVWMGGAGLVGAVAVIFLLINVISNAGLRSSLSGVAVEIASEFQQENDPPLGSPAPESAKIDNSMRVRDLSGHKSLVRSMTKDFNEMADALNRINDAESAKVNQPKLLQLADHIKSEGDVAKAKKLFNPNPKESRVLAREVGGDLRKAAGRIRTEMLRLQGIREFSMGTMFAMPQIERGIREIEREFVDKGDIPDADRYAEVRVAGLKTKNEREYIAEKLAELATPRASRNGTAPSAATRYALWPVDSPEIFSKKIDFGKVIRTLGKEIWVVADPIDPSVIRERLAKKEADEQKRKDELEASRQASQKALEAAKLGVPATASGPFEPEIPANADDITKGLLLVKSSSHFKRQEGLRLLQGTSFNGRDQEVFDGVKGLLGQLDIFSARDALPILVRCKTPGLFDLLAEKMEDDRLRDEVLKAVAPMKEPKLAKPLAQIMRSDPWKNADKALIAIGQPAEEAVIGQLASPDQAVRQRACEILAEIGTDVTLKAMKRLPPDKVPWVRDAAANAIRSIQNREKVTRKDTPNSL